MQPSTENLPWTFTHLTKPWHRSHPHFVIGTQLLVAAWMVVLGVLLLSSGDWPGVLLFVGAGVLLWFLYEFQRGIHMLDDSTSGPPSRDRGICGLKVGGGHCGRIILEFYYR